MLKNNLTVTSFVKPISWIKGFIYGLLLFAVYGEGLIYMVKGWGGGDFSYCYIMPLVIVYLLWEKREDLWKMPSRPTWGGMPVLLLGIVLYWLGELGGEYFTLYFACWVAVVGLCWIHMGWQKVKVIAFPLLMVPTMFPLPSFLHYRLSLYLKLLSSKIGVELMQLYGISAFRQGNVIDLGFTQLQVVDACSGIRYLFPMLILGVLLAYSFLGALWKRVVLVLSAIPIVVFANSLRITLTGILYKHVGAVAAEGFFHDFAGWFIFMCSLLFLLLEIWLFRKFFPEAKDERGLKTSNTVETLQDGVEKDESHSAEGLAAKDTGWRVSSLFSPPQFLVAVLLLAVTWGTAAGVEFREKIPIKKSFSEFPLQIAGWHGKRLFMMRDIENKLDLSEYIMADYTDQKGRSINFYVAYYESQRKGESIHSPTTCLPGGGWHFKQTGKTFITIPGYSSSSFPVNRAFMDRSGSRQLSYYWFPMRGRNIINNYQLKFYNFWDALTRHRTDGALVRLVTPVYEDEEPVDADKRLQGFLGVVLPVLGKYLPG